MGLFTKEESVLLKAISSLNYTNPFTPERIALEQTILGSRFRSGGNVWNMHPGGNDTRENVREIFRITENRVMELRRRIESGCKYITESERNVYEPLVLYYLFEKYRTPMSEIMLKNPNETAYPVYRHFLKDYQDFLAFPNHLPPGIYTPEKTFAMYFQIHRAFYHIFDFIIGGTLEAGALRAAIWESVFTCDIYRYHRVLFDRMNAITTLITGESGTGKELVASAVALSQYIPFHGGTMRFAYAYPDCFQAVQLSAMPKTMLESELFGHKKGAYTGALSDRAGYLEACLPCGSVFLDEIGEVDLETQVKLLRVLQNRTFQRLGENKVCSFSGKIIAATNRNLSGACRDGSFRTDLYYRFCADTIHTVPLRMLIRGDRTELEHFIRILAARILGNSEADDFTPSAVRWIREHLGDEYPWPGNVRELEQCVRNLIIRGSYSPRREISDDDGCSSVQWEQLLDAERPTADDILRDYLRMVYRREKTYTKTAAFANLDRRTVKKILLSV